MWDIIQPGVLKFYNYLSNNMKFEVPKKTVRNHTFDL